MRLYLQAESKNKIGYTPDWLVVTYTENGKDFELTLDIRGEIGYDIDGLNCRVKGELIPWVLIDEDGNEEDFSDLDESDIKNKLPTEKIVDIIQSGNDYRVGLYPCNNSNECFEAAKADVVTNGKGKFECYPNIETYFEFETELNI